jgi:hypothetical protein
MCLAVTAEEIEALIESTARAIYEDEWIDSGMWPIPDAYRWEVDDDEMHLTYRRTARVAITPLLALVAGQSCVHCQATIDAIEKIADEKTGPEFWTELADLCPRCGKDLSAGGDLGHWTATGEIAWCEPNPSMQTDYVLADDDPLDKVIQAAGETQCEANRPGELSLQYRCTKPSGHDGKFHEDTWHVQWPNMKGSKEPVTYPHCTHCYDNYGWCKGKTEHYSYCRGCQTGMSSDQRESQ